MIAAPEPPASAAKFPATNWTRILATRGTSPDSRAALEELCRHYWRPLYAYLLRQGSTPHDAQDLVQGFLQRLLARQDFASASPEKGRFRTFLLTSLRNYVIKQALFEKAQKRGGGNPPIPLDSDELDHLGLSDLGATSPEAAYDRRWARTVLSRALVRLEAEFRGREKGEQFRLLAPLLEGCEPNEYDQVGAQLGMKRGAVAVAVHRMRGRLQEILRAEILRTVADASDADEELRELLAALARP